MDLADTSAWFVARRAGTRVAEEFAQDVVSGATVLHYDEDFDRIAEITGQPTRWIVPRGTI